jgi:hypothetical protein
MTNNPDTRPCVPPVEGHYGLTNFGTVYRISRLGNLAQELGRVFTDDYEEFCWDLNGKCTCGGPSPLHDIIATISPEAMALAANPSMLTAELLMPFADLIAKAKAVLDYAEANLRAKPIESAPRDREIQVYNTMTCWYKSKFENDQWPMRGWGNMEGTWYPGPICWRETPPPPSDELPAPFKELGEALGKLGEGAG